MSLACALHGRHYTILTHQPHSLCIPVGCEQRCFGLAGANEQLVCKVAHQDGHTKGVRCAVLQLCPHGNGTHTECVGHVLLPPEQQPLPPYFSVYNVMATHPPLCPATLITVTPQPLHTSLDNYPAPHTPNDFVIDSAMLSNALASARDGFLEAVIVRTLPNDVSKTKIDWTGSNPPYFTPSAMAVLVSRGVVHLLVDLPSVDKEVDGGLVAAHKAFWEVTETATQPTGAHRTITELCFIPEEVQDGPYFLALHVAPLPGDAAPSSPVLYPCIFA